MNLLGKQYIQSANRNYQQLPKKLIVPIENWRIQETSMRLWREAKLYWLQTKDDIEAIALAYEKNIRVKKYLSSVEHGRNNKKNTH